MFDYNLNLLSTYFLNDILLLTSHFYFSSTFSSLLSLMFLNMEHNSLRTITSYLFSNNRQKMVISLAHNKLNFETKELETNATSNKTSPFVHTYNLKLLNLSHNNFKVSFEDWWTNGHDNLDISYNHIRYLWVRE